MDCQPAAVGGVVDCRIGRRRYTTPYTAAISDALPPTAAKLRRAVADACDASKSARPTGYIVIIVIIAVAVAAAAAAATATGAVTSYTDHERFKCTLTSEVACRLRRVTSTKPRLVYCPSRLLHSHPLHLHAPRNPVMDDRVADFKIRNKKWFIWYCSISWIISTIVHHLSTELRNTQVLGYIVNTQEEKLDIH